MNKLEERLHKVFMQEEVGGDVFVSLAKEAKEIAIEFANYCNSSGDCTEMFNQFIEEKYGE